MRGGGAQLPERLLKYKYAKTKSACGRQMDEGLSPRENKTKQGNTTRRAPGKVKKLKFYTIK